MVSQWGIISPISFNLYIEELLVIFKKSGLGCHINNTYMGALSYADDITISCPSLYGLNIILYIFNNFINENFIHLIERKLCVLNLENPLNLKNMPNWMGNY